MKVFIVTEGSKDLGLGHVTRCISLYQAFQERSVEPEFILNGDGFAEKMIIGKRYILLDWIKEGGRFFDIISGADIVVMDSYLAGAEIYHIVSSSVKVALYIDDNQRLDYPAGTVLNGTFGAEELDYRRDGNIDYLLGSKFMPLRRNFWRASKKEIKEQVENMILIIGGSDYRDIVPAVLKQLRDNFFDMKKNVIIGTGFANIEDIRKEADENTYLVYYPEAEGVRDIMERSDIAVSAGGQTIYELARMGVPTIAVPVVDNQMGNIKSAKRAGLIEYAGWWEEPEVFNRLVDCVNILKNKAKREAMSARAQEFMDGQGALRVCDFVLQKHKERAYAE